MKNNMIENFRRLWPVLLVWGLINLIAGPVNVLTQSNSNEVRVMMFNNYTVGGGSVIVILANVAFALVMGIAVFRYAHSSGALSVVHALPISRAKLFLSNWLTGLIFISVPQILTTVCLLPFAKFSFAHLFTSRAELANIDPMWDESGEHITNAAYYTDAGDLLRFLVLAFVTVFFIYSVTVLAGVITGNTAMQLVVTVFINAIAPIVFFIVTECGKAFLYGYAYDGYGSPIFPFLNPLMMYYNNIFYGVVINLSAFGEIVFIAVALGFSALAFVLYRKFKSERAGNSFTFNVAEYIFVIIVTLIGMFVGAALCMDFSGQPNGNFSRALMYMGAFAGSVITFIIVMMAARKTLKVFNMRFLKNFGIYAVCAVIFLVFTTTDITGFEKRVPAAKSVLSVVVEMNQFDLIPYRWGGDSSIVISDKEGVNAVRELHGLIANSGRAYAAEKYIDRELENYDITKTPFNLFEDGSGLSVNYKRTAGRTLNRHYSLKKDVTDTEQFRNLVGTQSWREANTIDKRFGYKNLLDLDLSLFDGFGPYLQSGEKKAFEKSLTKNEVRELAKLLDADYKKIPAEDLINVGASGEILGFAIGYEMNGDDMYSGGTYYIKGEELIFHYSVTDKYVNTIAWLKEKGYYDDMISATKLLKEDLKKNMG
jgi:ABC-2 type transport system permease protein